MSLSLKGVPNIATIDQLLSTVSCYSRSTRHLQVVRFLEVFATRRTSFHISRCFSSTRHLSHPQATQTKLDDNHASIEADHAASSKDDAKTHDKDIAELGAMSRRLADLAEQSESDNIRPARAPTPEDEDGEVPNTRLTSSPGSSFSEELKARLEEKIKAAEFKNTHATAIGYAGLSDHVGKHMRETATAVPWTGNEATEDTVLRMLVDTHKPLRGIPTVATSRTRTQSVPLDLRPRLKRVSTPERLATARDRANKYGITKKPESDMTKEERGEMSRMFRERFQAGARPMPATLQGLTALANEKIEEAIARGLFKNLPKGKPIERDYHAESPFIDTTEYLLNRVIQRQDIVPPWIEKQQELVKEVKNFRKRLRIEWKRHAIRSIASKGGGADCWILRAQQYAEAELIANPDPALALKNEDTPVPKVLHPVDTKNVEPVVQEVAATIVAAVEHQPTPSILPQAESIVQEVAAGLSATTQEAPALPISSDVQTPLISTQVFRDPAWEKAERAYHELNITNLNNITRSYNLIAPSLAQKPYYVLRRELLACYRDIAATLPADMQDRANNPNYGKVENPLMRGKTGDGGLVESWTGGYIGEKKVIYEERQEKAYGFKQFWKDLRGKN